MKITSISQLIEALYAILAILDSIFRDPVDTEAISDYVYENVLEALRKQRKQYIYTESPYQVIEDFDADDSNSIKIDGKRHFFPAYYQEQLHFLNWFYSDKRHYEFDQDIRKAENISKDVDECLEALNRVIAGDLNDEIYEIIGKLNDLRDKYNLK